MWSSCYSTSWQRSRPAMNNLHQKWQCCIQAVRQHVEREEREVFPRMRKSVRRARLGEIGDAMRKLQRKARAASPKATKKAAKKTLKHVA